MKTKKEKITLHFLFETSFSLVFVVFALNYIFLPSVDFSTLQSNLVEAKLTMSCLFRTVAFKILIRDSVDVFN
ncbi:CLUMA_CG009793, isoform A [Clunio marinus]|uniref:CLUMA_CG009793, isoform A n=1 Tax=Clunio marinus TaxID=568069 RepID=A0A1J1I7Y0_9DIPT|nr:CLUMA_CG009793, isoform A [Clunio marinus]